MMDDSTDGNGKVSDENIAANAAVSLEERLLTAAAEAADFKDKALPAIAEVENTGKPAGTVVEVLQPGYVLHDRLLRPAMVGVAKGGPAAAYPDHGESEPPKAGEHVDTSA